MLNTAPNPMVVPDKDHADTSTSRRVDDHGACQDIERMRRGSLGHQNRAGRHHDRVTASGQDGQQSIREARKDRTLAEHFDLGPVFRRRKSTIIPSFRVPSGRSHRTHRNTMHRRRATRAYGLHAEAGTFQDIRMCGRNQRLDPPQTMPSQRFIRAQVPHRGPPVLDVDLRCSRRTLRELLITLLEAL